MKLLLLGLGICTLVFVFAVPQESAVASSQTRTEWGYNNHEVPLASNIQAFADEAIKLIKEQQKTLRDLDKENSELRRMLKEVTETGLRIAEKCQK